MWDQFEEKGLILLVAIFANVALFVQTILVISVIGYLVGLPIFGGITALVIACIYVYIMGLLGKLAN